jgi:hypothetical protein
MDDLGFFNFFDEIARHEGSNKFNIKLDNNYKNPKLILLSQHSPIHKGALQFNTNTITYYINMTSQELPNHDGYRLKIMDVNYTVNTDTNPIPIKINTYVVNVVYNSYTYTINNKSILQYFNDLCKEIIHNPSQNKDTNKSIPESLNIERIKMALQRDKPLGHCITRALQLLTSQPLENTYYSSICKSKFLEKRSQSSEHKDEKFQRSGIPEIGNKLSDSPGLSSLAILFYDTVRVGSPNLETRSSSIEEYMTFMRNMVLLFTDIPFQKETSTEYLKTLNLSKIETSKIKKACKNRLEQNITIPNTIGVEDTVRELFSIQYKHAIKCGKIISQLFTLTIGEDGRKSVSINKNIMEKGFVEIDRITKLTRAVLVDYYTNCEAQYTIGVNKILEYTQTLDNPQH